MYSIKRIGRAGPNIILVHGLYSSAAAWIPVLKYFENYRISLVTIDFHAAIIDNLVFELALEISSKLPKNFQYAIGHSFGSFFLRLMSLQTQESIYIAPPFLASSFNYEVFFNLVSPIAGRPFNDIALVVDRSIFLSQNSDLQFVDNDRFLLPDSDEFFLFSDDVFPVHYFPGGHSDVQSAIEYAILKNLISC